MKIALAVALCVVAAWLAEARPEAPGGHFGRRPFSRSGGSGGYGGGGSQDYEDANYNFMYEVQDAGSGVDFGHREERRGEAAQGSYHVLLPDGRVQTVDYTADQGGYHANVNYQGGGAPGGYGGGQNRYRRTGQQGGYGGHSRGFRGGH